MGDGISKGAAAGLLMVCGDDGGLSQMPGEGIGLPKEPRQC